MKALTVCQPYAHLIASGEKWVENRKWTPVRNPGTIAIHAGASRKYLASYPAEIMPENMAYGAIVAIADVDVFAPVQRMWEMQAAGATSAHIAKVIGRGFDAARVEEILRHPHTEGPWGWVLKNVRRLSSPVRVRGKMSLWDVDTATRLQIQRAIQ